jgi:hypothetical protein
VPSKYFSQWAHARRIAKRDLPEGEAFEVESGVPVAERNPDPARRYRVVVRFAPFATASYSSETDGMGGYTPPKAGYLADLYVYAVADNMLIAHVDFHKRTEAPYRADAVPYVKAGVADILSALDPGYAQ